MGQSVFIRKQLALRLRSVLRRWILEFYCPLLWLPSSLGWSIPANSLSFHQYKHCRVFKLIFFQHTIPWRDEHSVAMAIYRQHLPGKKLKGEIRIELQIPHNPGKIWGKRNVTWLPLWSTTSLPRYFHEGAQGKPAFCQDSELCSGGWTPISTWQACKPPLCVHISTDTNRNLGSLLFSYPSLCLVLTIH